jgi:hypothetical protein
MTWHRTKHSVVQPQLWAYAAARHALKQQLGWHLLVTTMYP